MNILNEDPNKNILTTINVWGENEPILFVTYDNKSNWFFSENDKPIEFDDSFLIGLVAILEHDITLKTLPNLENGYQAYRKNINDTWHIRKMDNLSD
jgi:hypothetical protein